MAVVKIRIRTTSWSIDSTDTGMVGGRLGGECPALTAWLALTVYLPTKADECSESEVPVCNSLASLDVGKFTQVKY